MTVNTDTKMEDIVISTDTLVIGAGMTGIKTALEIANQGYKVTLIDDGNNYGETDIACTGMTEEEIEGLSRLVADVDNNTRIDVLKNTCIDGAAGVPGDFKVWLSTEEDIVEKTVGAIVVAANLNTSPLNGSLGIDFSDTVLSQVEMESALMKTPEIFAGKSVAFITGLSQNGNPLAMQRTLDSVLLAKQTDDCTVYVFAGDLKVGDDGLEKRYLEGRDKGAIYFKLKELPEIKQENGSLAITYTDSVLQRDIELKPDYLVIEDAIDSDPANDDLAQMLKVDMGSEGFLQSDNVHRYPVSTNRQGIFVAGGTRRVVALKDAFSDAKYVGLKVREFLKDGTITVPSDKAVLDTGKCTFCLTCFRCCPHGAIYWDVDNKPIISKIACQGCGICASECPMDAIQIGEYTDDIILDTVSKEMENKQKDPVIIAFCCENSAMEAANMAEQFKMDLPKGLKIIKVPCAGKIDMDYLLNAFVEKADGVMVMACHNGNCKSEKGSLYANWRAGQVQEMLEEVGLDKERLFFGTIASNMGATFSQNAKALEAKLLSLN